MGAADTLEQITDVFRDVLDDDDIRLSRGTTAADVQGWDSLAHVRLIVAVERAFGIKFSAAQVTKLKNVGELVDLVDRKTGAGAA